ncbi:hypothetical protein NE848_08780 [Gramella jeungdoensis]|uniref:FKBP-type peptidyl-prolyl cis-trans isomerase n=1 Tax=Gramella jeungdoensis TaxID=708091 RepID=A0ABT0Z2W3_9FLAO|nr:hypothetical protein [Gramella jeungdoensis]MCM8569472.1 hypothetical protein [Gramella jeungdoensis]
MKRLLGVLLLTLIFFSCQDEDRKELMEQPETEKVTDSIQVLTGEIVYGTNAAVIRGEDFVYGVTMDSLSKILAGKVAPLKSDDFDMIPVTVKAKILPNPQQEGWDEVIEIREIIEVPEAENVSDTIKE